MPSKEELLQSIHSDMKLDKAFFLKIYGYEITWPGFAEIAVKTLEHYGCNKAKQYYGQIVGDYQKKRDEKVKEVAQTLREEIEKDYERKIGDELRVGKYSSSLQQKNYSKKQKENSVAKLNRLKALI